MAENANVIWQLENLQDPSLIVCFIANTIFA